MKKDNRWTHGKVEFVAPPLPPALQGVTGCSFQEAIFDPNVGNEIYLAIFEESQYAHGLAKLRQFDLFCKTGVVRTSHGPLAFALFTVYDGKEYNSAYELFLDPYEGETIRLLSSAGLQSHFKVLIYDSVQGRLVDLFEFGNIYRFDDFAVGLAKAIGHEPRGDFVRAKAEFMRKYSIDDLIGE